MTRSLPLLLALSLAACGGADLKSTSTNVPPSAFSDYELDAADGTSVQLDDARNGRCMVPST